jgi:hypothetical protein
MQPLVTLTCLSDEARKAAKLLVNPKQSYFFVFNPKRLLPLSSPELTTLITQAYDLCI